MRIGLLGTVLVAAASFLAIESARASQADKTDERRWERCLEEAPAGSEAWGTCLLGCFSSPNARCLLAAAGSMAEMTGDSRLADQVRLNIAGAEAQVGDLQAALATVEQIADSQAKARGLAHIAVAAAEAGDVPTVVRAAVPAVGPLIWNDDIVLINKIFGALATLQAGMGDFNTALEMASIAYEPDKGMVTTFADALGAIAAQRGASTEDDEAEEAAPVSDSDVWITRKLDGYPWRLMEEGWIYDGLVNIAIAHARTGDIARSLPMASAMGDSLPRALILSTLARRQADAGHKEAAGRTIKVALDVAHRLNDRWQQTVALAAIAIVQAHSGNDELARKQLAAALLSVDDSKRAKSGWGRTAGLSAIATAQAEIGDRTGASHTLAIAREAANMVKENARHLALVVIAAAESEIGDDAGARETFGEALRAITSSDEDRAFEVSHVAAAQADSGHRAAARETIAEVLEWAQHTDHPASRANVMLQVAFVQVDMGDFAAAKKTVAAAQEAWQRIEHSVPREILAGQIVIAATRSGDITRALSMALKTAREIDRTDVRAHALSRLAAALSAAGDRDEAAVVLAEALDAALRTDHALDRALALKHVTRAQADRSIEASLNEGPIPAELLLMAGVLSRQDREWAAKKIAVTSAQEGEIVEAWRAAESIGEFLEVVRAFVAIATVQAANGDSAGARETLSRVQDQAPDHLSAEQSILALLEIATARAAINDEAGAREILSRVLDDVHSAFDLTDQTWIMIDVTDALIEMGDEAQARKTLEAASATLETIRESEALPFMQTQMAESWARAGDSATALSVAQTITDAVFRARALGSIALEQAGAGNVEGAKKTLNGAFDAGAQADKESRKFHLAVAQNVIAAAQAQVGDVRGARRTFADALQTAEQLDGGFRSNQLLGDFVTYRLRNGDVSTALQAAERISDPSQRSRALSTAGRVQAEMGDEPGAEKTFRAAIDALEQGGSRTDHSRDLSALAVAHVEAGNIAAALGVALHRAREIDGAYERTLILAAIAGGQAEVGDMAAANATLAEAVRATERLGRTNAPVALAVIAAIQAQTGDDAGAKKTLATALDAVDQIESMFAEGQALSSIEDIQVEYGNIAGAIQVTLRRIDGVKHLDTRVEAQSVLASAQAISGDDAGAKETLAAAEEALNRNDDSLGRDRALQRLAAIYAETGDIEAALQATKAIRHAVPFTQTLVTIATSLPGTRLPN